MNFIQHLEESLRDLAAEARKKHPGVKEASERATLKLRQLQNQYVSLVRKANQGGEHPTTSLFQSSEILHPFLLAANYPNASSRLLEISFRAMRLLMEGDAICPQDGIQMVRVWTIQAQVCVAYYQKHFAKEIKATEKHEEQTTSNSSSSWFGWGTSSSTQHTPTVTEPKAVKHAPNPSSSQSPEQMQKMAKDILSCLLQLLELLRNYPSHLTLELWTNAVCLASLFLHYVPTRHQVAEAARSTLCQVLSLFFTTCDIDKLLLATWDDLLTLATAENRPLQGAFSMCKKTGTLAAYPPSPEFALDLLTQTLKESPPKLPDKHITRTMGVTMKILTDMPKASVEICLRTVQWTLVVLLHFREYPNECRELFLKLIKPIALATSACRSHHDFEDGYVYTREEALIWHPRAGDVTDRNPPMNSVDHLPSLFPTAVLWKAGLALEAVFCILDQNPESLMLFFEDRSIMVALSETLSDFATIGASCRGHILHLVHFGESLPDTGTEVFEKAKIATQIKPTLFRKAEAILASGSASSLFDEESSSPSTKSTSSTHTSIVGETLWISLQGILRIADCMQTIGDVGSLLEETFAPTLAVLQHYMKRFTGAKDLIQLALKGYASLGDMCIPMEDSGMHRKALLSSLCKLSLPSWGKHDSSSQVQDHHISALLYLFRIVHTHYDSISTEWEIVLRTMEDLSVMAISSGMLSDESYQAALAVSAVFGRLAAFSTCFSVASLLHLAEALTEISKSTVENMDVVGDSDVVVQQRVASSDLPDKNLSEGKETISEKIMNIGVRAIYGGGSSEMGKREPTPLIERSKNVFCDDYRRSFLTRLSNSRNTIRVSSIGRIPYSLALLTDIIMANSFRFQECGDDFSELLSSLASSSQAIRPFTMDVMSMIIMSLLSDDRSFPTPFGGPGKIIFPDPMQSQLWAVEPVEDGRVPHATMKAQSDLLSPLCRTLRTAHKADVAEASLGALITILEGVGQNMDCDAWSTVIDAVASLSGDPAYEHDRSPMEWASCCLAAFRCLNFVVDDFLDHIISSAAGSSNVALTSLLDCCLSFGSSRHDINTSLTAVRLLWTIADQDSAGDSVDQAMSKLVLLASDNRAEVRNASVNTIFSCVVGRGGNFSAIQWESCFTDIIFAVYDAVTAKTRLTGEQSPSHEQVGKRYKVSLHHSRDSAGKQWIATQVVVLRGLSRVLRNYFLQLLDTTDEETPAGSGTDEPPWFQDAWVRILDFAFEAASQHGGRDTLDVRSVGVDLLVLCCQLASKGGIELALGPARVSTNMEVVNGALRSVREPTTSSKSTLERTHSMATRRVQRGLFLEAFEALHSYKEFLERAQNEVDDSTIQILQSFVSGLSKLYDCCKRDELSPCDDVESEENEASLEYRFVLIVKAALMASTSSAAHSKFLNQAQRGALNLLRDMTNNGSLQAFEQLICIAGIFLFSRKGSDLDGSEGGDVDDHSPSDTLSYEAALIVAEETSKDTVSDRCKLFVLSEVLKSFLVELDDDPEKVSRRRRYFKRMIPVVKSGLEAAERIFHEASSISSKEPRDDIIWTRLIKVLSRMLSPTPVGKDMMKISRTADLLEIVKISIQHVPPKYAPELCTILSFGASKSFEVAKQHDAYAKKHRDSEMGKKSWQHRQDLVRLFDLCYTSSCKLEPDDLILRSISKQVLEDVLEGLHPDSPDDDLLAVEVALIICRTVEHEEHMESLVISVFSLLCKLITFEKSSIREAVGKVFSTVDVAGVLETTQSRYEDAKLRADQAQEQIKALSSALESLQEQNMKLRKEVAVLEASSAL